ncbi:hypothetical protein ASG29_06590 [Sphingomonas sp. Leaf412]|uniref:hypothetical protein n=1 Tax=Sphingomonas sp. Leaf412 TaxID=1736370 RepID=UPI0006FC8803|nr:hypothetical protein [Sphingomonas sp. Leaf412]KQT33674.1 hypothetical protein ASG29_06590 [Sphingomonas sp. Leaf412]
MKNMTDGLEIVASIARGRDYWELRAGDVQDWVSTLPRSATQERISRIEWVGNAWDGRSDIRVGSEDERTVMLSAPEITQLLGELHRGILALRIAGVAPPMPDSVRTCCLSTADQIALVIDFDFGDFILPLCVDHRRYWVTEKPTVDEIAGGMLDILAHADRVRGRIAKREAGLRRALEETAAKIGRGTAPLWLRMEPLPHYGRPKDIAELRYVMLMVALNRGLVWAPTGDERIRTVREIRSHYGYHHREHRSRATALANLQSAGSQGLISEVALAIVRERGLDPREVLRQAVAAGAEDFRGGVQFDRNGKRETLHYQDGVLVALLEFEGGVYSDNALSLWGSYPETLALGATGRKLSDFVDHPAFVSAELVATGAESRQGALDIFHDGKPIPVEAAVTHDLPQALAA